MTATRQDRERLRELLARCPKMADESVMRAFLRAKGCHTDDAALTAAALVMLPDLPDATATATPTDGGDDERG